MKNWRTFERFPETSKTMCPVCGTHDQKECVLIAIQGTQGDEGHWEVIPVHTDCINPKHMFYSREAHVIYMFTKEPETHEGD